MIFQNLRQIFSLDFFYFSSSLKFSIFRQMSLFLKIIFLNFCLFLFNFVSMDYSRYVIKASDGSFINLKLMWILRITWWLIRPSLGLLCIPSYSNLWNNLNPTRKTFLYDVIKMHPDRLWTWEVGIKIRRLRSEEIKGHKSSANYFSAQRSIHR